MLPAACGPHQVAKLQYELQKTKQSEKLLQRQQHQQQRQQQQELWQQQQLEQQQQRLMMLPTTGQAMDDRHTSRELFVTSASTVGTSSLFGNGARAASTRGAAAALGGSLARSPSFKSDTPLTKEEEALYDELDLLREGTEGQAAGRGLNSQFIYAPRRRRRVQQRRVTNRASTVVVFDCSLTSRSRSRSRHQCPL